MSETETESAHFQEHAAGLAALPADDPQRVAANAHARGCAECARALREGERLLMALDHLPPPPAPAARTLTAVARPLLVSLSALALPTRWLSVVLVCSWLAMVMLAKHRMGGAVAWVESAVLAATAVVCLTLFRRVGTAAVAAILGASVVMVALAWRDAAPAPAIAMACLLTELGAAVLPFAIVVRAFVKRRSAHPAPALVLAAAAGAVVGQAALHLTCPERDAGIHLLVSHLGGVAAVALVAGLIARFVARPAEAKSS